MDALRALAGVGVVAVHNQFGDRGGSSYVDIANALTLAFDWVVLAFFFLSGLLLRREQPYGKVVWGGVRKLLIPFALANLAYNAIFWAALRRWVPGSEAQVAAPSLSWLWVSPAFQLYFLPCLFLAFAVVHPCVGWAVGPNRARRGKMALFGLMAMAAAYYLWQGFPVYSHGGRPGMLPLYIAAFAYGVSAQGRHNRPGPLLTGWAVLAVIGGLSWLTHGAAPRSCWGVLIPHTLLVMVNQGAFHSIRQRLAWIGPHAGGIYLWHTPLLMPGIGMLVFGLGLSGIAAYAGIWGLTLGVALAFTVCLRLALPPRARFAVLAGE